ncbi:nucleotide-binding universal stress UspA family protein [Nocardioides ginsengisegetis]|uniref:Nucleotide-binding universal stress UspA family protein n=1 Tax=Nocardioides ginsengisegetis TaxID=661491 RepID=A0A7W3IZI5_9ACTN|nr:universal stress protein [Nocardioides ginsengisegetis]MBA8803449.1 nucleotide-binding universal stress UspA family protein [Nocardioides ginsengisegetis]
MASETRRPVLAAVGTQVHLDALLDAASVEAAARGSDIGLVHVASGPGLLVPTSPDRLSLADPPARQAALSRLYRAEQRLRERTQGQVAVTTELLEGAVVDAVVARSAGASVVVLQRGPEHRGRLTVLAHLGGIAARSHAPVLCVPSAWRRKEWDQRPVCVGVEPDPALSVVRTALEMAQRTTGTLRLVCVVEDPAYVETTLRDRVAPVLEEFPDVAAQVVAWRGRPVDALLSESRECSALVLGRHHHLLPVGSHLGPVVCALLREAACPVLVVDPTVPAARDQGPAKAARPTVPGGLGGS